MRHYRVVQHPVTKEYEAQVLRTPRFRKPYWDFIREYPVWWELIRSAEKDIIEDAAQYRSDYIIVKEYTSDNPPNHS